jgi:probable rRNA maturation factor
MIDVLNLQRKIKIGLADYRAFTDELGSVIPEIAERSFSVAFIGDNRMKQLNELFRDKNVTTDVLSFPHEPDDFEPDKNNLGDIVISVDQAQKQSAENGVTLENEIKQLILHGLLHLCGYDHETDKGEMNARELKVRKKLGI